MAREYSLDGTLFATSEYLKAIECGSTKFFRMYELQLTYITNLFRFKGNKDIERISPDIIRQYFEFGKVGVMKLKGRYVPLAITTIEKNIYREIKKVKALPMRQGNGYSDDMRTFTLDKNKVVVGSPNFNGLPFIFFWENAIEEIIALHQAAMTGSISSIKKFKRTRRNNSSWLGELETKSMMNPNSPHVDVIEGIQSYADEDAQRVSGNNNEKITKVSRPNDITFETSNSGSAATIWDNLKEKIQYEYYHLGREINTNKKNERNIEGEIESEKENFDIIREGWLTGLKNIADGLNEIFGDNITVELTLQNVRENKGETDGQKIDKI